MPIEQMMARLRRTPESQHPRFPISIGLGGLAPAVVLAAVFGAFAARAGLPVVRFALLGGIGGTASLLVHELGHVRAARRYAHIKKARVSLIWLGAATTFEGSYDTGREQARVAIGGPQASFGFALSLIALCFLPLPMLIKAALILLALFNVAVGLLNLLPAHPLDGYRVLLGLLWSLTGSEGTARRILRRIGLGCAVLELPSAAFLLVEKPHVGAVVIAAALSLVAQRRFTRKPAS